MKSLGILCSQGLFFLLAIHIEEIFTKIGKHCRFQTQVQNFDFGLFEFDFEFESQNFNIAVPYLDENLG
jgi:hypothetical protein